MSAPMWSLVTLNNYTFCSKNLLVELAHLKVGKLLLDLSIWNSLFIYPIPDNENVCMKAGVLCDHSGCWQTPWMRGGITGAHTSHVEPLSIWPGVASIMFFSLNFRTISQQIERTPSIHSHFDTESVLAFLLPRTELEVASLSFKVCHQECYDLLVLNIQKCIALFSQTFSQRDHLAGLRYVTLFCQM